MTGVSGTEFYDDRPGGDSRRVSQRPLWRIAERMFADSSIPVLVIDSEPPQQRTGNLAVFR
jgi:hypothetical protein